LLIYIVFAYQLLKETGEFLFSAALDPIEQFDLTLYTVTRS
jgi:hypothetical protein